MKHVRVEHCGNPNCDGCAICNLFLCAVCGGAEGSLTTECPGIKIDEEQADAVYAGKLDFVNGSWRSQIQQKVKE